jgi:hypothetical protein
MEVRNVMLTRILRPVVAAIVLIAVVGGCDWMEPRFSRSPKLTLVLSERADDISIWAPVIAPSGTALYYLRIRGLSHNGGVGELWRARTDGTQASRVMEGSFRAFALSRDGSVLALATDVGYLLLTDADGRVRDTLTRVLTRAVHGVWFSRRDSERLYFSVDQLHFAINLDGSGMHEVPSDSVDGLPSVQASGHYSLVTLHLGDFQHDLGIMEAVTADSSALHAMPYRLCSLKSECSCWSPDEDAVFFSAYEWQVSDPMRPTPAEIWKYERVFGR